MTKLKNVILVLMTLFLVFSCTLVSADTVDNITTIEEDISIVEEDITPIVEENTTPIVDNSTEFIGNFTVGNTTESIGNFTTPIVTLVTPTPIPTLASMANAKLMSDGSMYPNYKVEKFNILDDVPDYSKFGYAKFYLRAGGSALDLNVWIVKNGENVTPFDATYNPDKSEIKDQNADYKLIKILPDGESDVTDKLDAGEWIAYIQNGNGGQMETQKFNVGGGEITRVSLLGHAVSNPSSHETIFTIVNALYGKTHCTDVMVKMGDFNRVFKESVWSDWSRHHPERGLTTEERTIVDSEAYDERVAATYKTINHNAVYAPTDNSNHIHAAKVNDRSDYDFIYGRDRYEITGNSRDQKFVKISDAYSEVVVDVPAHIVHHREVTHKEYRYVITEAGYDYVYVGSNNGDYLQQCEVSIYNNFDRGQHPAECTYTYVGSENVCQTDSNMADVTKYFTSHLTGNTVSATMIGGSNDWAWLNSFVSENPSFVDPAPGIEKGITVTYEKDGITQPILVIENVNLYSGTTITLP